MKKLYDTTEKKVKFLKRGGNIATFKKRITFGGRSYPQILIGQFIQNKDGYCVKGMYCDTKVYPDLQSLLDRFDWDKMELWYSIK